MNDTMKNEYRIHGVELVQDEITTEPLFTTWGRLHARIKQDGNERMKRLAKAMDEKLMRAKIEENHYSKELFDRVTNSIIL